MDDVEQHFVRAFPLSSSRIALWDNYQRFLEAIQRNISLHFTQWINGSFISQTPDPKDIDMVVFLDAAIYRQKEALLEKYWSFALEDKGLDVYWVEAYKPEHVDFVRVTRNYQTVWRNRFGKDRLSNKKGFIEITL